ncbi:Na+-dependent transporter [Bradyrhizobium prioriisuperbiae]|uniref:Na+-dependent transporter n=1 Tax=Bradyrhizobium prioriisuperbiae TaxID=2854389 RepID=UPI0028E26C80|nr:Na+-dependent transporter [Bradyrhizobium prioritasuperba]
MPSIAPRISASRIGLLPVRLLAWIGRQGARAIAALVFIGLAVPPLGAILKPYVTPAVFILLCISFMRLDADAMRGYLKRPGLVIAATVWTTIVVPMIAGLISVGTGFNTLSPGLFLGVMLQMVASPMMAAPALAALMGFDATLVLVTLVTGTALIPLTAPIFAHVFFDGALTLSPLALGGKLLAILGGALLVAALVRWLAGAAAIARHKQPIDGLNILVLLVFVSGVMENVAATFWAEPLKMLGLTLLAFAVFLVLLGLTVLVFRGLGRPKAMALGLMVCQRNMGLMMAATDGALPGLTWLYFALSQFPIYLSPLLLKPLVGRGVDTDRS